MALSKAETLALDALIYEMQNVHVSNKPIKLKDALDSIHHSSDINMTNQEFDQLKTLVDSDSKLANLDVISVNPGHDSNANMAFFEDPSDHHQYAIFAGTAADEWDDDATNAEEVNQPNKIAMQKWFDSLPIKIPPGCTVSGHSDGGNDAMYLTIKDGAKVSDCLSFNGEGFGDAFVQANAADIANNKAKITCINCAGDPVGHMENPEGWITSYQLPSVVMPDGVNALNPLAWSDYYAHCHGISSLCAHDRDGNLELALTPSTGSPDPFVVPLRGFTTWYLDEHIPEDELETAGLAVDDLLNPNILVKIGGAAMMAITIIRMAPQILGYTIDEIAIDVANFFTSDPDRFGFATRDFTRATEDRLLAIASQVQRDAGSWWDDIGDFFESCVSWPVVKNMIEDTDAYWSALLDSNNISTTQLKQLFDDVYAIDQHYGSELGSYRSEIDKINAELTQVVESLQV
jgi:hypothetical protein